MFLILLLTALLAGSVALGLLWGACLGRRDYFSFPILMAAPIFSGVLIVGCLAVVWTAGERERVINPLDWRGLITTIVVYGSLCMLGGAVPALLGSSAGQLVKLWLLRRYALKQPTERAKTHQ
ncbi:hypothetical protein ETAA8_40400 [Anatilimnocola aggregata]|uniref:Uncharacterized protein n=1 Tax=Anatilimnocola aggregata TaxID=2528021 RepID=A0A517YFC5_9BACT|nr:hypothetical protein ETAA8_40400 [Anatilimnocola aggregata]